MSSAREIAELAERDFGPKVLRFSRADVAGRNGYRWQSIQTNDEGVSTLLCAMWNNRAMIAEALRRSILQEKQP